MLLRTKDRDLIIDLVKKNIHQESELWAFGSRVNGDAHDTSDLNLVLVSKDNSTIDINDFMKLKAMIQKSNIPLLVQILDWNRIPKSFHENILKDYRVLKHFTS